MILMQQKTPARSSGQEGDSGTEAEQEGVLMTEARRPAS